MEESKVVCENDVCMIDENRPTQVAPTTASSVSSRLLVRYGTWITVAGAGVTGWVALSSRSSAAGFASLVGLVAFVVARRMRLDRRFQSAGGVASIVEGGRPVVLEFSSEF